MGLKNKVTFAYILQVLKYFLLLSKPLYPPPRNLLNIPVYSSHACNKISIVDLPIFRLPNVVGKLTLRELGNDLVRETLMLDKTSKLEAITLREVFIQLKLFHQTGDFPRYYFCILQKKSTIKVLKIRS